MIEIDCFPNSHVISVTYDSDEDIPILIFDLEAGSSLSLTLQLFVRYGRPGRSIQAGNMARGPIYQEGYRPQLSGHETFPLRYGWLKKAFDAIAESEHLPANKTVFNDVAIAAFGVGRNMVASIRYWANASGVISETSGSSVVRTTPLGQMLFGPKGRDPFMEHPTTLWLVHWQLSGRPERTTWFWAFSHFPAATFEREHLVKGLDRLAKELKWTRAAAATLKNDVACFVRTYAAQPTSARAGHEDTLESPLTELGLIKATGKRDGFRFVRGPKSTLTDGVFVYALLDFWLRISPKTATLSFEAIAHEAGSPGRVFLLDENDVVDRLGPLEDITNGHLRWSETAGLKQVVRNGPLNLEKALGYIERDYKAHERRKVA
jgi:hypothetical protein